MSNSTLNSRNKATTKAFERTVKIYKMDKAPLGLGRIQDFVIIHGTNIYKFILCIICMPRSPLENFVIQHVLQRASFMSPGSLSGIQNLSTPTHTFCTELKSAF
jgi:hypothetical protein